MDSEVVWLLANYLDIVQEQCVACEATLLVLSDSKIRSFAPNSEFLSKTLQSYSEIRST